MNSGNDFHTTQPKILQSKLTRMTTPILRTANTLAVRQSINKLMQTKNILMTYLIKYKIFVQIKNTNFNI